MRKILIDQSPHRDEAFSMKAFFLSILFFSLYFNFSLTREKNTYMKNGDSLALIKVS